MKVAVIGLSYVGLPLAMRFARSCVNVLGLDADPKKVELLNNGRSYIKHIQSADIAELISAGKFYASTDFGRVKGPGLCLAPKGAGSLKPGAAPQGEDFFKKNRR